MACYFRILLDGTEYTPCDECGFFFDLDSNWDRDYGCPNCGGGGLTEADILAIKYEQELYDSVDWKNGDIETHYPDTCYRCKGRYNASNDGLYHGLCQKCEDADALKDAYCDNAYRDEIEETQEKILS